ncbi:MAG: hypothetical protein WBW85_09480, partial [Terriglobales bacterium]
MTRTSQPGPKKLPEEDIAGALYDRSGAAVYGMTGAEFAAILEEILRKHLPANAPHATPEFKSDFCAALRLEELALARACAAGNERAWHDFISRYRQKLHSMALHITRDGVHAAELADSLFADLYGVNARDGARSSKLVFYNGRGSLEGWLRTVLAQEFVNRYRKQKRTVSLEEQTDEGAQFAAAPPEPACVFD